MEAYTDYESLISTSSERCNKVQYDGRGCKSTPLLKQLTNLHHRAIQQHKFPNALHNRYHSAVHDRFITERSFQIQIKSEDLTRELNSPKQEPKQSSHQRNSTDAVRHNTNTNR
jgi:hypothetical protein